MVLCCTLAACICVGQTDTVRVLQQVQIDAAVSRLAPIGQVQYRVDSSRIFLHSGQNTADALRAFGLTNVRSYGAALTTSIALRGGAANQTALIWNGFKLQKPASGLVDFSLTPVALFDELIVVPGAHSALWGSSAVGGIVALQNTTPQRTGVQVHHARGAFGHQQTDAKISIKYRKWASVTHLASQSAKNHYTYLIPGTSIRKQQVHADAQFQNILQEFVYQPVSAVRLRYFLWANRAQREVPPLVTQTASRAKQWDTGLRNALDAQWRRTHHTTEFRMGSFEEKITYHDSAVLVFSEIRFRTFNTELESRYRFSDRQSLHVGVSFTQNKANAPGYAQGVAQTRTAAFASWKIALGRVLTQTDLRSTWGEGRTIAFIPAIGMRYDVHKIAALRVRASRTFREPTLNDLYWQPGGNPNLKSELGWSMESGADVGYDGSNWSIRYSGTAYWRKTDNLIYWAPTKGTPFWSPDNLSTVRTIGLENRLEIRKKLAKATEIVLHGSYEPISALNQKTLALPAINAGEQLWYVPKLQYGLSPQLRFRASSIAWQYQRNGAVTTPEGQLAAVGLHNLSLQTQVKIKQVSANIYTRIDNLQNRTWYSIDRRPMPGRSWMAGIRIQL
jgi:vitamin B12 transporter